MEGEVEYSYLQGDSNRGIGGRKAAALTTGLARLAGIGLKFSLYYLYPLLKYIIMLTQWFFRPTLIPTFSTANPNPNRKAYNANPNPNHKGL